MAKGRKDPNKVLAGKVRAFKMTPEARRAVAAKAARARWSRLPKGSKARSASAHKAWRTKRRRGGRSG